MNDFLLDMAENHFDLNEQEKARVASDIPKIAYAANLLKQHKTLINELIDLFDMLASKVAQKEGR